MNVDDRGRVPIAAGVLRAVPWWKEKAATFEVCAELTERGLVRVYQLAPVRQKLELEHCAKLDSEADFVARAASADRYRTLRIAPKDERRLFLTKEVCPWLGFTLGEEAVLYAQAFEIGFEVMTTDIRLARLDATKSDRLGWHIQPPE